MAQDETHGDGNSSWDIDATVPTHGLCEHTPNQP